MEYAKLGNTDIEVSKLCVGCMSFGKAGTMHKWTLDEEQSGEVIRHALDLGINFFDTANGYSEGTSEEYLDDAADALNVKLSPEDIAYLEEMYVPHPIVGAIDKNPAEGVILLDEKK